MNPDIAMWIVITLWGSLILSVILGYLEYEWSHKHLANYRIYELEGEFYIQQKTWFFWKKVKIKAWERSDGEFNILFEQRSGNAFLTLEKAKTHLTKHIKYEKEKLIEDKQIKNLPKGEVYRIKD